MQISQPSFWIGNNQRHQSNQGRLKGKILKYFICFSIRKVIVTLTLLAAAFSWKIESFQMQTDFVLLPYQYEKSRPVYFVVVYG